MKREREKRSEIIFEELMTENCPNLGKKTSIQRLPKKRTPKRSTARHMIIKVSKVKDKERILKAAREKQLSIYKETPIRPSLDFFGIYFAGR